MTIRLTFEDIEKLIKSQVNIKDNNCSFHWNPDNKDFNKNFPQENDVIVSIKIFNIVK